MRESDPICRRCQRWIRAYSVFAGRGITATLRGVRLAQGTVYRTAESGFLNYWRRHQKAAQPHAHRKPSGVAALYSPPISPSVCSNSRTASQRRGLETPDGANPCHSKTISTRLKGTRAVRPERFNAQFPHLVNQRGARQAQTRCGAVHSTDQPIGLLQYVQNVLALRVGERAGCRRGRLPRHQFQVGQRQPQHRFR